MKERRGQYRARSAAFDGIAEVCEASGATRSDDADLQDRGDGTQEIDIESCARAVAIDGSQQDLAGAEGFGAAAPVDGVEAARFFSAS